MAAHISGQDLSRYKCEITGSSITDRNEIGKVVSNELTTRILSSLVIEQPQNQLHSIGIENLIKENCRNFCLHR